MHYIDYNALDSFYTISELLILFGISKAELKAYCGRHDIEPEKSEDGYGLSRHAVRQLHNLIYKEAKQKNSPPRKDDPWND